MSIGSIFEISASKNFPDNAKKAYLCFPEGRTTFLQELLDAALRKLAAFEGNPSLLGG